MVDFLKISTRFPKKGVVEIYPKFIVRKSSDLMIRGRDFYAIWLEDKGFWSLDEEDAIQLIDKELDSFADQHASEFDGSSVHVLHMWDSDTKMIEKWHKYCQKNLRDNYHQLDERLIFSDQKPMKKDYASNMVTGFMRLDGQTIGAVANRGVKDTVCACGAKKAASFINLCDSFNIPVFMIANASAYGRTEKCEKMLPFMASKLIYAYANATVPKVTLVTGKAFGGAYVMMGSRALGADVVFAWPNASIGAMDAKQAAKIVAEGAAQKEAAKKFAELQNNVASAAARGYVDTVIEEADTRKYVIGAFEMLYTKKENRPLKKHGTI